MYFGPDGTTVQQNDPSVLKRANGDPVRCADACAASNACRFAFYKYDDGACYLISLLEPAMISTWVGAYPTSFPMDTGGITFRKDASTLPLATQISKSAW